MESATDEDTGQQQRRLLVASSKSGLRAHNERLVLSLLRLEGPSPKARVAELTGLSAQTASVIMRKLEEEGLIERCAPVRGKVGQPSVPMRLAPRGALFFGVKVGRRSADMVLVDFLGQIIDRTRWTYHYPHPDDMLRFVRDSVEQITARISEPERDRIAGLGIAIPGYLWEWARQVGVPPQDADAWRDRDFRSEVDDLFDFPVFLQNDASCACGAELVFGQRDYPSNFLYFYIGHFGGGGVVLNNELFTGPTGNAGALGPLPIPSAKSGLQQLVDVVSLSCLEAEIASSGGDPGVLWSGVAAWEVDRAILEGWMDRAAEGLAYALAAACSIIDFELVVIDGWLPVDIRRELIERTRKALPTMNWTGLVVPQLQEGTIGPDARSLGAASLPLSNRFLVTRHVY